MKGIGEDGVRADATPSDASPHAPHARSARAASVDLSAAAGVLNAARRARRPAVKHVLLLATIDTKREEIDYMVGALADNGVHAHVHDVSVRSGGQRLQGQDKLNAMRRTAHDIIHGIGPLLGPHYRAILGLGGGTGGEIIIDVMRALPFSYPKILVTTLPFDPRDHVADTSIILVPALADICGLNATLRQVMDNTASMISGICMNPRRPVHAAEQPSIGITALGSTGAGVNALVGLIRESGREATVFHSNGYGGAAFQRWCESGAFEGAIDYTTHEMTRIRVGGVHTDMPHRFQAPARAGLPHVVLPGGMNFMGLGAYGLVSDALKERPHYHHSAHFTHVKLTESEMRDCATALIDELDRGGGDCALIAPMGGFSSEDQPGGAIEDEALRGVFLDAVTARVAALDTGRIEVRVIDEHINARACALAAFTALEERS